MPQWIKTVCFTNEIPLHVGISLVLRCVQIHVLDPTVTVHTSLKSALGSLD